MLLDAMNEPLDLHRFAQKQHPIFRHGSLLLIGRQRRQHDDRNTLKIRVSFQFLN